MKTECLATRSLHGEPMIKLSDVKVRPQYRRQVRYRLLVLEYARAHGPTAAGRHYGSASARFGGGDDAGGTAASRGWSRRIPGTDPGA